MGKIGIGFGWLSDLLTQVSNCSLYDPLDIAYGRALLKCLRNKMDNLMYSRVDKVDMVMIELVI